MIHGPTFVDRLLVKPDGGWTSTPIPRWYGVSHNNPPLTTRLVTLAATRWIYVERLLVVPARTGDAHTGPINKTAPEFRRGMNEAGYVRGLYELWDSVRNSHPNLIIDNCASGGRRHDLETMTRSIPLWPSDYSCGGNEDLVSIS